jgi:hypothetical protein
MPTVPVPPTFSTNDSSLSKLNALSACASFLGQTLPSWHFGSTTATSVPATTATLIPMAVSYKDLNGPVWTSTGFATIVYQGVYKCDYSLPFNAVVSNTLRTYLLLTTTATNPLHGTYPSVIFALRASYTASAAMSLSAGDQTPIACYPGDTIKVMAYATYASALVPKSSSAGVPVTGTSTYLYPSFTGRYLSYA